jgi:hypothetical protein
MDKAICSSNGLRASSPSNYTNTRAGKNAPITMKTLIVHYNFVAAGLSFFQAIVTV